tara:strand:- start:72 stop:500 length:429 start_codon:yes stop_codon:yes gene_type:complete
MSFPELLAKWLKGHRDAIALVLMVHDVVEIWDDLIDKDKEVAPEDINRVFRTALIELPRNPFYAENFGALNTIIESAIFDWHTANAFEASRTHLETAFGLRCTIQSVTIICARIVGGPVWAQSVSNEIRSIGESYAEYVGEQ